MYPGYYFKIMEDDSVRILYNKQPIILDVQDYFMRIKNIKDLAKLDFSKPPIKLERQPKDVTNLTANEYLAMSIKELEDVLKKLEEKELYEKCADILELINYKKESLEDESNKDYTGES